MVVEVRRLGLVPLGWSVDTRDWARPGSASIRSSVLDSTERSPVVLMHRGGGARTETVAALRAILPALAARGVRSSSRSDSVTSTVHSP